MGRTLHAGRGPAWWREGGRAQPRLWTRRFVSDPGIIGKTISLSGDPFVIIGVIGPEFDIAEFGQEPDLFIPFQLDPNTIDQGHFFQAAARIKAGVTLEQAQGAAEAVGRGLSREVPGSVAGEQQLQRRTSAAGLRPERAADAA